MSCKKNLDSSIQKEKNQFAAGLYTAFDLKFSEREIGYKYLKDHLLAHGINICEYPNDYASPEYIKEVETMVEEIFSQIKKHDKFLPAKKIAYIKGFILGVFVRSNIAYDNYTYLQDNLEEIKTLEDSKKAIDNDWFYNIGNLGRHKAIAFAYLDGQLDFVKKSSLTNDEKAQIYREMDIVSEMMFDLQQLCDGTHIMYKK